MRAVALWLISSWIGGIIGGVLEIPLDALLALIGLPFFIELLRKRTLPHAIAAVVLISVGCWWGSMHFAEKSRICNPAELNITGTIDRIYRLENSVAQYIVHEANDCNTLVYTPRFPEYEQGNTVNVSFKKYEKVTDLPAELHGYRDYLLRNNIQGIVRYPQIDLLDNRTTYVGSIRKNLRERMNILFTEPEAGLIRGMMLDDRGGIEDDIDELFTRAGVNHIISISGLHLSLIAGSLLLLFMPFSFKPWTRTIIVIMSLWGYMGLVGWPIAAIRATFFWTLILIAFRLRALISLPTIFLLTFTTLLTISPRLLFDIGFQLSFAAIGGIGGALFLIRIEKLPPILQKILSGMLVSLGAMVATLPIIAWHFGTISWYAILANIIIIPTTSFLLIMAALTLCISSLFPSIAYVFSYLVHLAWMVTYKTAAFVTTLPGAFQQDVVMPWWSIAVYYSLLVGIAVLIIRFQKRSWREVWQ